jgi:hypothetical protein
MNTVPKLIDNPSWATIASFTANELAEFGMFAVMSIVLIAATAYGIYSLFRRPD